MIGKSRMTTIGYSFRDERIMLKILSKINTSRVYIDSFDECSIKSSFRDLKINDILNNRPSSKVILIDIADVPKRDSKSLSSWSGNLQSILVENGQSYSVIVTSPVNLDFNNNYSFSGGSALVYGSDLVISLGHGYLRINKNRNGYQDEKISFEELDLELEKIAYI
jgi:hypothetical protein